MREERPRYGLSVSYRPCPDCMEGTMEYDADAEADRCTACGTLIERE